MARKKYMYILIGIVILCILAAIIFFITVKQDTTLSVRIMDAVSRGWVWDATVSLQDKYMRLYYQSDTGPVTQVFTGLTPGGEAMLGVSAPHYRPVRIPLTLQRGDNTIKEPVMMVGYEIPDLKEIFVYREVVDGKLFLNPRPINSEGKGIGEHPCLAMLFYLRVSVQVIDGIPVLEPVDEGSERGEELFRGKLEWEWDSHPDTFYRYRMEVPINKIKKHNAPYCVYDHMVIFPHPEKITKEELENELERVMYLEKFEDITNILDVLGDRIMYFVSSSWNQKAFWGQGG
jgi:hypothetical protein